jgi:4-hydroxy-tetrahydrodipicolinate synthase
MIRIEPALREALCGISGILVTPFDREDKLAPGRLKPIIDRAIDAGVHALVANGNTGEFFGLRTREAEAMIHAVAEQMAGRSVLIGGVGRSVHDACALARTSRGAGAAALMIHQPPDPFVAPRGLLAYVEKIAEAGSGLPVLLYLRNDGIGLDAIEKLTQVPGVAGVKWACPTPLRLADAIRRCDPEIVFTDGLAESWAPPFYAVGARGFTSGLINVWPEHSLRIHTALEIGDYGHARNLIDIVSAFEELRTQEQNGTNVSVLKAALMLMGNDCGAARPPAAWPLTPEQAIKLGTVLDDWGLAAAAREPAKARALQP